MKTLDQTLMDQRVERLLAEVEEARTTAQYWKAEHLAGNAEIERLRAELDAARRTAEYWKAEHLAGNAELAETQSFLHLTQDENERLRAERDRALDRIAAMAAELDTPYAWHHLHHGLRYERGEGEGWWPLYMVTKPEDV